MSNETVDGQPVADEMIRAWAAEAERGYDVDDLRKRGRPTLGDEPAKVVQVRMDPKLLADLMAKADEEHISRSEAIRRAVKAWSSSALTPGTNFSSMP